MKYTLTRDIGDPERECQHELDIVYEVSDYIPASMTEAGWRDEYTITFVAAWCDGVYFPLTDAEIQEVEMALYEEVEV